MVIKTFVLSIFKWPFYTGFTVCCFSKGVILIFPGKGKSAWLRQVLSYYMLYVNI